MPLPRLPSSRVQLQSSSACSDRTRTLTVARPRCARLPLSSSGSDRSCNRELQALELWPLGLHPTDALIRDPHIRAIIRRDVSVARKKFLSLTLQCVVTRHNTIAAHRPSRRGVWRYSCVPVVVDVVYSYIYSTVHMRAMHNPCARRPTLAAGFTATDNPTTSHRSRKLSQVREESAEGTVQDPLESGCTMRDSKSMIHCTCRP